MVPEKKPASIPSAAAAPVGGSLSLDRLRAAFAQMLGAKEQGARPGESSTRSKEQGEKSSPSPEASAPTVDPCEISPRTIAEAMLFVGRPDGEPFSAREMAAAMRGVSPAEIESAVAELNEAYQRDAAPYEISGTPQGYRLALRDNFRRMRDKFHGRIREAKLSPAAIEVLSVVAYNQPTTAEAIQELRGAPSGAALNWLVRRKLVRIDRPAEGSGPPQYATTERFLRLFGLDAISALPRNEELEKL